MKPEFDAMPYDATLLSDVIAAHGLTVTALANRSGYDATSIYRYLSGERTVPSTVLRALFELTLDMRIVGLIAGVIPVQLIVLRQGESQPAPKHVRIPPVNQLVDETNVAMKATADAFAYIAKILADERVDQSDSTAIENFKKHSAAAQRQLALVDAALTAYAQKVNA